MGQVPRVKPGFRHSLVGKLIVGRSPGQPIAPATPRVDDHRRSILDCEGEGRHDGEGGGTYFLSPKPLSLVLPLYIQARSRVAKQIQK